MNWEGVDWKTLERLRSAFLTGAAGERDYWQSESDLASYDRTFAQRIGWKWDYVLAELKRRGWSPPAGEVLDWGCGSGIASRAFLDHFGTEGVATLGLWDRSPLAMRYAAGKARGKFPGLKVRAWTQIETHSPHPVFDHPLPSAPRGEGEVYGEGRTSPLTLLVSHVLTELKAPPLEQLLALAFRTTAILWIEPGTHEASRTLIAVRERLGRTFNIVAPCTHQAACGMLAPGKDRHWCHHFAPSPPGVFTDGQWRRFANLAGIDLRSLPLSFLVLDKRPIPQLPAGTVRVIGRPRLHKAEALLFACDANGVGDRRLKKRTAPDEFKRLKKAEIDPLQIWNCAGEEIVETRPLF